MKDIWKASKLQSCRGLREWKDSISNMLWWSFATSSESDMQFIEIILFCEFEGNEVELREKVLSIPLHCSNHHTFPNNVKHKACCHGELLEEERYKPWLQEGSKVLMEH